MDYLTIPAPILLLVLILTAVFSALTGHTITRWIYRGREDAQRELQRRLNAVAGAPGWNDTATGQTRAARRRSGWSEADDVPGLLPGMTQVFTEPVTQTAVVTPPRYR